MEINLSDVVAVTSAFQTHEKALVSKDVAAVDGFFHNDLHTLRFGHENLHGYGQITTFRAAPSPASMARTLSHTVITTPGRIGRQMQVWLRFAKGRRIVTALLSVIDAPDDPQ